MIFKIVTARLKIQKSLATGQTHRDSESFLLESYEMFPDLGRSLYSPSQINTALWQRVGHHQRFISVPRSHDSSCLISCKVLAPQWDSAKEIYATAENPLHFSLCNWVREH